MSDIESEAEFEATEAAYQRWLADYGHKLASDGLGRHLFWAGWQARGAYERAQTAMDAHRQVAIEDAADRMATAIRLGLRDGLRDCQEACEHPGCEMIRARKAYLRVLATSVPGATGESAEESDSWKTCQCQSWAYDPITHGPIPRTPSGHHPWCTDDA